jgi:Tfp pilus assembly protein PilV
MNLPTAKSPRNPLAGFTIMEVGVAAFVLAFTLVGMIGVIESGAKMMDLSRKQTLAAQILHSEMDKLRTQNWTTVSNYAYSSTSITSDIDAGFNATKLGFTAVRSMSLIAGTSGNPALVQITYTVSWTGVTGTAYTRTSTTYVGNNGLSLAYQRS